MHSLLINISSLKINSFDLVVVRKPYVIVEAERKKDEEIEEVAHLEKWRPASPLQIPTTEWH